MLSKVELITIFTFLIGNVKGGEKLGLSLTHSHGLNRVVMRALMFILIEFESVLIVEIRM